MPTFNSSYYSSVNQDILNLIPVDATSILEVGCGSGALALTYRKRNPTVYYVGVEIFKEAASMAVANMNHTIYGDITTSKTLETLDEVRNGKLFDTLIFGDVLEHLYDPWSVLAKLRSRMTKDGQCIISIPNIAHWSVLQQQLRGRWDYTDQGLLDKTHIRFFTLQTALELFHKTGWSVLDARARILWPEKTEEVLKTFIPFGNQLGIDEQKLRRDLSAFQWVIRARNT
jgi:2-polyprenyl-3-methyl-5-hydroxy-6-metoxy-1,4-benzoquinol methylase